MRGSEDTSQRGLLWDRSDILCIYQAFINHFTVKMFRGICVKIVKDTVYKSKNNMLMVLCIL